MKTLLLALGLAVVCTTTGFSQITRDQAAEIVKKVVSPGTHKNDFSAYLTLSPLPSGTTIKSFGSDAPAITLTNAAWFGYIDDAPFSLFTHPTRFVLVDAQTGATEVKAEEWWPLVNGINPFRQAAVVQSPTLFLFSSRDSRPIPAP